jgi:hypothetical protein
MNKDISISREGYAIVKDDAEILCCSAVFRPFDNLGRNNVKTFRSESKARTALSKIISDGASSTYSVLKVQESIKTL